MEEDQFFDTREEEICCSVSDRDCDSGCCSVSGVDSIDDGVLGYYSKYDFWSKSPESVSERRQKFLSLTGLSLDRSLVDSDDSEDVSSDEIFHQLDVKMKMRVSSIKESDSDKAEDEILSNQSSPSFRTHEEGDDISRNDSLEETGSCETKNSSGRPDSDNRDQDDAQSVSFDELQRSSSSCSSSIRRQMSEGDDKARNLADTMNKLKRGWLKKLGALAHIVDRYGVANSNSSDQESTVGSKVQKIRVHHTKKQSKELSSLYSGQEFVAHKGSILTMKFSLDGRYLASAGEDGTVRVWKVIEDETSDRFNIQEDPSSVYFTINHLSQLTPIDVDKETTDKTKSPKKLSDKTCVILPPKVFKLLEKPLHEFRGHSHEVLDLSWSKNGVSFITFCRYNVFEL